MALWSSSAALVAITDSLNRVYDIEEGRSWWKTRLTAILLTIALAVFVLVAIFLVMVGPTLAEWLASQMGLGTAFEITWKILQWPVVLALIAVGIGLIYYVAPDAEQDWEWITPGAVLATVLWLVASLAFKIYVANFADYNATYGSLGGLIVLLLWFYLTGLAILIGAEMNAEIEQASASGRNAGDTVPGQKKKLGAAAARADEQIQHRPASNLPQAPSPVKPFRPKAVEGGWSSLPGALLYLIVRFFRRERT
jgi:membrane protein